MKNLITGISVVASLILLTVCVCLECINDQLRHENEILNRGIGDRDMIIENQNEFIIQLTYQHEDDEILAKEMEK